MKRICSLALACLILVVSLAPAASAAESDDLFLEILDWCLPNAGNQYIVYGSNSLSCYFATPTVRNILYIDVVCEVGGGSNPSCQFGGDAKKYGLNVEHIEGYFYRFYGEVAYYSNIFNLYFSCSGMAWVRFHSVRISYSDLTHYPVEAYCGVSTNSFADTIHYVPTDQSNSRRFMAGEDPGSLWLSLYLYCLEWKKYDFLEFQLSLSCADINSIACRIGTTVVPCEISYLDNTYLENSDYYVTIRIDVSDISKDTTDSPMIILQGQLTPGDFNNVSISYVSGFLRSSNGSMIGYYYRDLIVHFRTWFSELKSAITGSKASGNAFKEESSGLISDLDNISASMDSVQRPSMDSINMDFTTNIGTASILVGNLFNQLLSVPWLSSIFLASVTIALISYILYGKD